MTHAQKQERHTKLFEVHKILSEHDRRICKENSFSNKYVKKQNNFSMNEMWKRSIQTTEKKLRTRKRIRNLQFKRRNGALYWCVEQNHWILHNTERKIFEILFQKIDISRNQLYYYK